MAIPDLQLSDGFIPDDDGFVADDDGFVPDVTNDGQLLDAGDGPDVTEPLSLHGTADISQQATPGTHALPSKQEKLQQFAKTDVGGSGGFDPISAWATVADEFEKRAIDPIIKWVQDKERARYEKRIAPTLRKAAPKVAFTYENLAKPALGETELNIGPESQAEPSPAYRAAVEDIQETFGQAGAAYYQALAQGMGNLPFYLIPGVGENAIAQGVTGGALSALADPSVSVSEGAAMGGAGGAVISGAMKLGGKALKAASGFLKKAPKREVLPIAVVPPSKIDELADTVVKMPETAIPTKDVPEDAVAIVVAKEGDDLVAKALKVEDGVPVVQRIEEVTAKASPRALVAQSTPTAGPNGTAVSPKRQNVIVTPEAREVLKAEAPAAVDDWAAGKWIDGDSVLVQGDQPEFGPLNDVYEGKVLVIEGGGGDGTARLYDINSPKLQIDVLRHRNLHEVTLPDGTKVLAFPGPGFDNWATGVTGKPSDPVTLLRPDPEEFLPGALKQDMVVESSWFHENARLVDDATDLRKILDERQRLLLEAEETAERMKAASLASQMDVQLGGTGDGGKLPPPPPVDGGAPIGPPQPNNMTAVDEPKARWWDGILKAGRTIDRKVLPPTARGPLDIADEAARAFSIDNLERYRSDTLKSLQNQFPEIQKMPVPEQHQLQRSLTKYLTGDASLDELTSKYPQLKADIWRRMEAEKAQIAFDESRLRQLGMLGPEDTIAKLVGGDTEQMEDYAVRLYWRHLMKPGEWATLFKKDERAVATLTDEILRDVYSTPEFRLQSIEQRKALASKHLDILLGDEKAMALIREDPERGVAAALSEARGSLKARKDLKTWEKAALGEIDNAFIRIAETRARQKQLVLQGEIYQSVAENARLSVAADAASPQQIQE